ARKPVHSRPHRNRTLRHRRLTPSDPIRPTVRRTFERGEVAGNRERSALPTPTNAEVMRRPKFVVGRADVRTCGYNRRRTLEPRMSTTLVRRLVVAGAVGAVAAGCFAGS